MTKKKNTKPTSMPEGLRLIEQDMQEGSPPPSELPRTMHPNDIAFAHSVFQPRSFDGHRAESAEHINALKDSIRNTPGHLIEPVTVWWSGKRWIVIDGFHRVSAYQQLAKDKSDPLMVEAIRVDAFTGSLTEAFRKSTALNSKDKLNMTKSDKLNRAWKMVCWGEQSFTINQIIETCSVGQGTVSNMRRVRKKLVEKLKLESVGEFYTVNADSIRDHLLKFDWKEAQRGERAEKDRDEEWAEQEARRWCKRLLREFGPKIRHKPVILAKALELTSERFPKQLVEIWQDEARELFEELGEEALALNEPRAI
jgi:hypothetical protein